MTAAGGVKAGTEILMSYGQTYWQQRAKDARADVRYGRRDERRGGMIAYTVHDGRRVAFVEEIVRSWEATGHTLQTGHALFTHMVRELGRRADEVHLIVRRDNVHARDLYTRIGFTEQQWALYEPLDTETYMVVRMADMERKLADMTSVHTELEVEVGAGTMALRAEDPRRGRGECTRKVKQAGANGHSIMRIKLNTYCCGTAQASARCRVLTSACGRQHVKELMRWRHRPGRRGRCGRAGWAGEG